MKKSWKIVLISALVVFTSWMLWPRNLGEAFETEESIAFSAIIYGVTDGRIDKKTEEYQLSADSEKGKRIGELLSHHTYHLTLGSLAGKDVIEGATITFHLNNSEGTFLSLMGGTTELFLDHRVCRLGYWGRERGTELCEAILNILREP